MCKRTVPKAVNDLFANGLFYETPCNVYYGVKRGAGPWGQWKEKGAPEGSSRKTMG